MQAQQQFQPSIFEYTKIVSVVYAIILVSFGIIFPIAEALKDQWLKTIYNTVFLTSNLTLSCIFLVYLLFFALPNDSKLKPDGSGNVISRSLSSFKSFSRRVFRKRKISKLPKMSENETNYTGMITIAINDKPHDMFHISPLALHNVREHSICSTNSVGGIDLGILKKTYDINSNHEKEEDPSARDGQTAESVRDILSKGHRMSLGAELLQNDESESNLLEKRNLTEETSEENTVTYVDAESFGSVFTHHGSSMFLRLGALIFGLGNLVYYALEIQANLFSNVQCSNTLKFGWIFIWKFVFVLLQTFFLFKHATVHTTKHRSLVWFGMVHLLFTNVTLWIHTLVREIKEEYHYETLSETYLLNSTKFSEALHAKCDSDLLHSATKYLMPFVLEYSLIAVGSISSFLFLGGIDHESKNTKTNRHLVKVFSLAPSDFDKYNRDSEVFQPKPRRTESRVHFSDQVKDHKDSNVKLSKRTEILTDFQTHQNISVNKNPLAKSHVGMFGGIVLLSLTTVACVVFLFSNMQGYPSRAEIVFYSVDITIHSLLLIACIAVFILTRSLAFAPKPISTDDILLLIAAFGSLTYEAVNASALFTTMAALDSGINYSDLMPTSSFQTTTYSGSMENSTSAIQQSHVATLIESEKIYNSRNYLQLVSATLGLVETAVQTLLIIVSLRRYPASLKDASEMPGRGTLAFLIVGNLAVWVLRTILCKNLKLPIQTNFYGGIAWHLLMNINLPLLLFFRFHSSVCFADIWKVAYELFTRPERPLVHDA